MQCVQARKIESIHIFSFKKLWVECAVCAMCAGENNRHIYSCHSGWFGLMWVDCGKCGCRIVSESSVSFCGKVTVSEEADCEEI